MNYAQLVNDLQQKINENNTELISINQQIIHNETILENMGFFGNDPENEEMEDLIANQIETQQQHLEIKYNKLETIKDAQVALLQAYNLLKKYH